MTKAEVADLETKARNAGRHAMAEDCRRVLKWCDEGSGDAGRQGPGGGVGTATHAAILRVESELSVARAYKAHCKLGQRILN